MMNDHRNSIFDMSAEPFFGVSACLFAQALISAVFHRVIGRDSFVFYGTMAFFFAGFWEMMHKRALKAEEARKRRWMEYAEWRRSNPPPPPAPRPKDPLEDLVESLADEVDKPEGR